MALLSKTGFSRKGRKGTKFAKLFFAFFSSLRPLREGFPAKVGRARNICLASSRESTNAPNCDLDQQVEHFWIVYSDPLRGGKVAGVTLHMGMGAGFDKPGIAMNINPKV